MWEEDRETKLGGEFSQWPVKLYYTISTQSWAQLLTLPATAHLGLYFNMKFLGSK